MRSVLATVKTDGRAEVASPGVGFRLRPGAQPPNAAGYSRTQRPGSYPVHVRIDGQGEPLIVANSDSFYFPKDRPFTFLQLVSAESGELWQVDVFEHRDEGQTPSGARQRVPFELAPTGTAVPTTAPAAATDGYPLRNGQRSISTYFAGTLSVATLWVMLQDGTWFDTQDTADPSSGPRFDARDIRVSARRFAWRAASASMTMTIEVDAEHG